MKFGPVPVANAQGAILAHSLGVGGKRLKKGRVLNPADLAALTDAGFKTVTVAQSEPGDVLEDAAAGRIVSAFAPNPASLNLRTGAPFTGRANLYAECQGVLEVDTARVHALNAIDEAITLATLPAYSRVTARQMLGTVKIIPYGCAGSAVERAEELFKDRTVLKVHPIIRRSAHLILTKTPGMKDKLIEKGASAVLARLSALGIDDVSQQVTPHELEPLSTAIRNADADMVLILTGSATSDREDIGPSGLIHAGGAVTRFGMPVDPGNLLFLGTLGEKPVIGLPGCARSPKLNGADWVIERIACGLDITSRDIADMGVGGLLKEISSRPQPREGGAIAPQRPVIAALLLAAGASSRMRGADKLLEPIEGTPILRHVADMLLRSGADQVCCVVRPEDDDRRAALQALDVKVVSNPRAAEGMATSIAAGVTALPGNVDAVLIMLGDMPDVSSDDINRLIAAFDPDEDRSIVRSTTQTGNAGHPVLFGRRFFEALTALDGDRGARTIIAEHPEFVVDVVLNGEAAAVDLDTPEAWAKWRARSA